MYRRIMATILSQNKERSLKRSLFSYYLPCRNLLLPQNAYSIGFSLVLVISWSTSIFTFYFFIQP